MWQIQIQRTAIWGRPSSDMFQRKIDDQFKELPNIFGIADDILISDYYNDGKEQDNTLRRVLPICQKENLKFNKDKCHFRCSSVPFFDETIPRHDMRPNLRKLKALTNVSPKYKKIASIPWNK